MDLDSITRAIEKLDQDRDLIARAKGSHDNIEGSTHESISTMNLGTIKRMCPRCNKLEEFYPGYVSTCKECHKKDMRDYQQKHPERNKIRWERNQVRRYGDLKNRVVGGSCEICGTTEKRLAIHHKDGNGRNLVDKGELANNTPENLMTLCQSCHMKIHAA